MQRKLIQIALQNMITLIKLDPNAKEIDSDSSTKYDYTN